MNARGPCRHCGGTLEDAAPVPKHVDLIPARYDLEALAAVAEKERAYDETVKVRVTQDDIRKLVEKRRPR